MSETNGNGHKPRKQRNYSDSEKAAALVMLDFCGGNESEAARRLGIPRASLREWVAQRGINPEVTETRQEKKADLADALEELAFNLVEKLLASEKTGGVDLGIVVDKMLLLRGQPNSINQSVVADAEKRQARILQLVQKAKTA